MRPGPHPSGGFLPPIREGERVKTAGVSPGTVILFHAYEYMPVHKPGSSTGGKAYRMFKDGLVPVWGDQGASPEAGCTVVS